MKPEHYQMLAEAKMTVEQIGVVMRILAEAEDAMKVAEEARKSVARERVQRWREKQKDAVTLPKHNGNATVRLTRVEGSSSKKDISGKEESKNLSHEFESEIWPSYPLKLGKPNALKAYIAARQRASFETIRAGVVRYAAERAGQDKKYTKQAQGWFSRDGWDDEPIPQGVIVRPPSTASPQREPRNTAERALMKLQSGNPRNEPPNPGNGRLETGNGRGQTEGPGIVRRYAGPEIGITRTG
jgi:hypothetical protein